MSECSANLNCVLHAFSAFALESSLTLDHITTRHGPESNHIKQLASSSAVHTLTRFGRFRRCSDFHVYTLPTVFGSTEETSADMSPYQLLFSRKNEEDCEKRVAKAGRRSEWTASHQSPNFGDSATATANIAGVENELTGGHREALVVHYDIQ